MNGLLPRHGSHGPSWPLYTPEDHVLRPQAQQQRALEWFDGRDNLPPKTGKLRPPSRNVSKRDLFVRWYPVEGEYFTHSPLPCASLVARLPPPDYRGCSTQDPKFACGPISWLAAPGCQIWSIGSAGETCFEEYVHQQAPSCGIHTFDPTLNAAQMTHMQSLERRGVLLFHQLGLGDSDSMVTLARYGTQGAGVDKCAQKRQRKRRHSLLARSSSVAHL